VQTGGPSGLREQDTVANTMADQIAFGATGSPGLAALAEG
jgi:hypothetical protein